MKNFFALVSAFRSNRRGNVAVIFTIAIIPILGFVGAAIDYSIAARTKTKIEAALDTAVLVATSKAEITLSASQAQTDATAMFNAQLSTYGMTPNSVSIVVSDANNTRTVAGTASNIVPTTFMKIMGFNSLTVSGASTATASLLNFIDVYLMLDVSGSMGLPSTDAEQTRLAAINPDNYAAYPNGCTFACHFTAQNSCGNSTAPSYGGQKYNTNGYCKGYALSRTAGNSQNTPVTSCPTDGTSACIQLRADAVGYAVQQLLLTANAQEKTANQFRIGLYPFIQFLDANYFPVTTSISGAGINTAAANLANLLDTGSGTLGSGGTHFENAFPTMSNAIKSVGDGTSQSSTKPFVFLVTDGAQNFQTHTPNWAGNNSAKLMDYTLCTPLKQRGITVSILYIPYQPIQNPTTFANSEDFAVNAIIPNIPGDLQQCASPGFFFTANTPADITTALNKMFNQALVASHLSK